ncbi:MAG: DUF2723 domain-containing protein [candidate division Zixibacteria bacterium]|nr:DUF2723 domain-containing protein [candidate division Zixibacteria bacterium]
MKKALGPAFLFFFFFLVYLVSAAPSVFWWDSGELVANVRTLGVPHRPGFPLYVLLAKIFSYLPIGNFVFQQNLFSGFCGALALVFFHLALVRFLGRQNDLLGGSAARRNLVAFFTTLAVGFTFTFWIQAVRAEVYTLGAFLFTFSFYCFMRATSPSAPTRQGAGAGYSSLPEPYARIKQALTSDTEAGNDWPAVITVGNHRTARWFWLGIFAAFLGLGNHHVTLLATFPFLFAVAGPATFGGLSLKKWVGVFFLFLLGVSTYLYLPVRAWSQPFFNWGGPSGFSSTANLVLATDSFKTVSLSVTETFFKMHRLLSLLFDQLGIGLFFFAFGGLLILLFANKSWFWKMALLLVGNLLVTSLLAAEVIPDNPDLHGYLVFSLFALGLGIAVTIAAFFGVVERAAGAVSNFLVGFARVGLAALFLLFSLIPWTFSRPYCDLSENRIALKMAQEALSPVPPGGVVFLDSPALDFVLRGVQYGELWRRDVVVVNRAFLAADWYRKSLVENFPRLATVFSSVPKKKDPDSFFRLWASRLKQKKVPIFVEFTERDRELVERLQPTGFLFQLIDTAFVLDTVAVEQQLMWEVANLWTEDDRVVQNDPQAVKMLVLYLYRSGLYYEWRGAKKKALSRFQKTVAWGEKGEEVQKRILKLEKEITLAERKKTGSVPIAVSEPKKSRGKLSR